MQVNRHRLVDLRQCCKRQLRAIVADMRRRPEKDKMRYLIIACVIAAFALAGPIATHSRADDAHHPEKAAGKKVSKAKPKQQKKPAEKTGKSQQQSKLSIGGPVAA